MHEFAGVNSIISDASETASGTLASNTSISDISDMSDISGTPLYNALRKYAASRPAAFHMPGHKLGKGIPPGFLEDIAAIDITEIPGSDNLHSPTGVIKEAQELAARAFGADETYFLVNGSTCGIHAMIMACCREGDSLIVSRDCHKSVIAGLMLANASPIYINPLFDSAFGIPTAVDALELEKALLKHPGAAGVLITRPNYYGACADLEKISRIVHSYGKVLMVDEAHGAHLAFNRRLPPAALECGADMCVQSAHKTLPAFTQGAYLHVKSRRVDTERLKFYLRLLQTTSPSYLIMAMLDVARAIMETRGASLLDKLLDNIKWLKGRCEHGGLGGLVFFGDSASKEPGGLRHDETRLVINVGKLGITGFMAEEILRREHNIQVEMSDPSNVVCITSVADAREDFGRLHDGLAGLVRQAADLPHRLGAAMPAANLCIPPSLMKPGDAMNSEGEKVELAKAKGRICRCVITPYPPGIPLVCPGEVILQETVEYIYDIIKIGGNVNGIGENFEVEVVK